MTDRDETAYEVVWHGAMRVHAWSQTKGELLSTDARASTNGNRAMPVRLPGRLGGYYDEDDPSDILYRVRR
jgi:hypothetical protein